MKEIKLKNLWAVDIDGVQWAAFRYKKEAIKFASKMSGNITILKKLLLTNQY
jgi:hypothetical protein